MVFGMVDLLLLYLSFSIWSTLQHKDICKRVKKDALRFTLNSFMFWKSKTTQKNKNTINPTLSKSFSRSWFLKTTPKLQTLVRISKDWIIFFIIYGKSFNPSCILPKRLKYCCQCAPNMNWACLMTSLPPEHVAEF